VKVRWHLLLVPSMLVSMALLCISQYVFLKGSLHADLGMGKLAAAMSMANYRELASDGYYLGTLRLSIVVSLAATFFTLLLAFPVAYIIARMQSRAGLVLLAAVVVSSFVSIVVKVLGLILIFNANGPFNTLLLWLGWIQEPLIIVGSISGVVLGLIHYSLGFAVLLFYSAAITVPRSLEDAAAVMGATRFGVLRQVVLPLCMPALVAGALVVFNVSMGGFTSTALIGSGKVITLPVLIQRTTLLENNFGMAAALAALLLMSVLVINFFSVLTVTRMQKGLVL
jgi:putative spermidine/putrescine transport system permease protein